jgi:MFS family permease
MFRDVLVRSKRGERALDLLNFFMADVQTGFGPFVAVYLTTQKWTEVEIGLALSVGTITSVISQVPAGGLVDAIRSKRLAAAAGIISVIGAALMFALLPHQLPVIVAEVLHGFASSIITPAIAAISLGLVGHAALGERLGRNASFASIGNGIAAGVMGAIGTYLSSASVFWLTAGLGLPALAALWWIPRGTHRFSKAGHGIDWHGLWSLFGDRRVLIFGACIVFFHLSNAAMLPFAASEVTKRAQNLADLIIAACIVVPQAVVAFGSPYIGGHANEWGRRPMLLLGWGALPIRGLLLALLPGSWPLVAGQSISGISAAVFGVMLPLIAADVTRDKGHFNLCMGAFGLCAAAGATLSTAMAGWAAEAIGPNAAFYALALAGVVGTVLVWRLMPETRFAEEETAAGPPRQVISSVGCG